MRAIVRGPSSAWVVADSEALDVGAREVLVQVRAAGLNRADLLMRDGAYVPDDASWNVAEDPRPPS